MVIHLKKRKIERYNLLENDLLLCFCAFHDFDDSCIRKLTFPRTKTN